MFDQHQTHRVTTTDKRVRNTQGREPGYVPNQSNINAPAVLLVSEPYID